MRTARNPQELKTMQEYHKWKEERALADRRKVLSRPEGRRVVWWLLNITNFFEDEFFGNSKDYYNKGKRSIGSMLHSRVTSASGFKALDKMFSEFKREQDWEKQFLEALQMREAERED